MGSNTESRSTNDDKVLTEIQELLETSLKKPFSQDDCIRSCDQNVLSLLSVSPEVAREESHKKLYEFPYQDVPECWRRLYTEACLWIVLDLVEVAVEELQSDDQPEERSSCKSEEGDDKVWKIIEELDKAIIMTGAPERRGLIDRIFGKLAGLNCIAIFEKSFVQSSSTKAEVQGEHLSKRQKHSHEPELYSGSEFAEVSYPTSYPTGTILAPPLRHPVPVLSNPSLREFQERLEHDHKKKGSTGALPLIIEGAISQWSALQSTMSWKNPRYLLSETLGGRRLVPIEIGRSYTDADWSQRIVTFREFMERFMLRFDAEGFTFPVKASEEQQLANEPTRHSATKGMGYLAQHDLFSQIPSLRDDIRIPDYCYSVPPMAKKETRPNDIGDEEYPDPDGEVMVNAWFGPAGTMTPLHTDPHHNVLAQVVGQKYVRLYALSQTAKLYPRGKNEWGVDMSNTSSVDLDEAMEVFEDWRWDSFGSDQTEEENGEKSKAAEETARVDGKEQRANDFRARFPDFREADYAECILSEGQCLFIPKGWWHYVRSLSPSFSVSFWWD